MFRHYSFSLVVERRLIRDYIYIYIYIYARLANGPYGSMALSSFSFNRKKEKKRQILKLLLKDKMSGKQNG
jgi:hypothetical protein